MHITYTNKNGESITLRQQKPYFLQRVDGTGTVRNAVTTFKAPNQDGAFYISGSLEMRNITLEGTVVCATADEVYNKKGLTHNDKCESAPNYGKIAIGKKEKKEKRTGLREGHALFSAARNGGFVVQAPIFDYTSNASFRDKFLNSRASSRSLSDFGAVTLML